MHHTDDEAMMYWSGLQFLTWTITRSLRAQIQGVVEKVDEIIKDSTSKEEYKNSLSVYLKTIQRTLDTFLNRDGQYPQFPRSNLRQRGSEQPSLEELRAKDFLVG